MPALPFALGVVLLVLIAAALTGGGVIFARRWLAEADGPMALTAGALVGPAVWLAGLNLCFYLAPSPLGVGLASGLWALAVGLTVRRSPWRTLLPARRTAVRAAALFAVWAIVAWVALANRQVSGYYDETWTMPLAATMLRGNFPPVSPWAPDLATSYHYGLSLFVAGLRTLTGLDYVALFEFVSAGAMAACLILVGSLIWRLPLGPWLLAPAVLLLLGRGAKQFARVPWLVNVVVPVGAPGPGLRASLGSVYAPPAEPASGILVAGPPQVELPQFPMAIGLALVVLHHATRPDLNGRRAVLLGVLLATVGLLEESAMLATCAGLGALVVVSFLRRSGAPSWRPLAMTLASAVPWIALAGGVISDALLRGEGPVGARGAIVWALRADPAYLAPWHLRALPGGVGVLEVTSWPVLLVAALVAWWTRNWLALALAGGGWAAGLAYRLFDYRFVDDIVRLDMFARVFGVLALALAVASIRRHVRVAVAAPACLVAVGLIGWPSAAMLLAPTLGNVGSGIAIGPGLGTGAGPSASALEARARTGLRAAIDESAAVLDYAGRALPQGTRVLTASPPAFGVATGLATPFTTQAYLQFVPIAGPEYLDAIRTLAPAALRQLGTTHVHATPSLRGGLTPEAHAALDDPQSFARVTGEPDGSALYRVLPAYLASDRPPPPDTYLALAALVPADARVYVSPSLGGEARNRAFYALRTRRLLGTLATAGDGRLSFPIDPFAPGTPVDFIALPDGTVPIHLGRTRADAVWFQDGVRLYDLRAPPVKPASPGSPGTFAIEPIEQGAGRLRFRLEVGSDGERPAWTGTEWLVFPSDAGPYFEPRLGSLGVGARQWFQGPLEPQTATLTIELAYDHAAGTLRIVGGAGVPADVPRSEPDSGPGPWVFALVFRAGRSVAGVLPVAGLELTDSGIQIHPFRGADQRL
ncbi:MAG: hypothetical protein FJ029_00450 [Actinobacteria bacterium]|nr:hypothetical protein [Actinomycetota bacterium]